MSEWVQRTLRMRCVGWVLAVCGLWTTASASRPLNVVVILADDLGATDLGCTGSTFHKTPELDRLAAEGVLFTRAYAPASVCSPARAGIHTGRHPASVGITDWIPGLDPRDRRLLGPDDLHALPAETVTYAEVLRDAGYATFFAGKWHLGKEGSLPEDHGFAINLGGIGRGSPPGGYTSPYENPRLPDGPPGEYLTDRLTDESLAFIRAHADRPFLVHLSFYAPHLPIEAHPRYLGEFEAKARALGLDVGGAFIREGSAHTRTDQTRPDYASMVRAIDANVGRILETLEAAGLAERTVVIFTSDNGGLSTARRPTAPTANLGLRAGKGWLYEGGLRVPLIVRVPGQDGRGRVEDAPVSGLDLFPTILEAAGLTIPDGVRIDGRSLLPILRAPDAAAERTLWWHFPHYHASGWQPGAALRRGPWKLVQHYETGRVELFHLGDDPTEAHDRAAELPELARTLLEALADAQERAGADLPTLNPRYLAPD